MVLYKNMNETNNNSEVMPPKVLKKRGRPKVNVNWPNESFTFSNLTESNKVLSSSSLRKKMRTELVKGNLVKVGTLKTAFGRPQNIYGKS